MDARRILEFPVLMHMFMIKNQPDPKELTVVIKKTILLLSIGGARSVRKKLLDDELMIKD